MSFKKIALSGVYFIRAGDHVKVGWSGHVGRRMELIATDNAQPIELLNVFQTADRNAERRLHGLLKDMRVHREWFDAKREKTAGEWADSFAEALRGIQGTWLYTPGAWV